MKDFYRKLFTLVLVVLADVLLCISFFKYTAKHDFETFILSDMFWVLLAAICYIYFCEIVLKKYFSKFAAKYSFYYFYLNLVIVPIVFLGSYQIVSNNTEKPDVGFEAKNFMVKKVSYKLWINKSFGNYDISEVQNNGTFSTVLNGKFVKRADTFFLYYPKKEIYFYKDSIYGLIQLKDSVFGHYSINNKH